LSKLSVSELANEFAVSAEEVVSLLRSMDIPIRSHMSMLADDQGRTHPRSLGAREAGSCGEASLRPRQPRVVVEPPRFRSQFPSPWQRPADPVRRRRKAADVQAAAESRPLPLRKRRRSQRNSLRQQEAIAAEAARLEAARIEAFRAEEAAACSGGSRGRCCRGC
jgi:hypothetical protein